MLILDRIENISCTAITNYINFENAYYVYVHTVLYLYHICYYFKHTNTQDTSTFWCSPHNKTTLQ